MVCKVSNSLEKYSKLLNTDMQAFNSMESFRAIADMTKVVTYPVYCVSPTPNSHHPIIYTPTWNILRRNTIKSKNHETPVYTKSQHCQACISMELSMVYTAIHFLIVNRELMIKKSWTNRSAWAFILQIYFTPLGASSVEEMLLTEWINKWLAYMSRTPW